MSPQKPPQRNPRFARIDWNEISKRGLLERINREIMFPIGLAVYREPATGSSGGALIAPDGVWHYVDEAHPLSDATILAHLESVADINSLDIRDERESTMVETAVIGVVRTIASQLSASKGAIFSAVEKGYPPQQCASPSPAVAQPVADERDAARLDWIDEQRSDFNHGVVLGMHFIKGKSGQQFHGKTLRAAIDNARAALSEPAEGVK